MTISPLSTNAIIPDEIRQAFPFLIPFGIIGLWRWALFVIRIIFWLLYRPLYPKRHDDGSSANKYKTTDVTIIVPTIDNGEEFKEAARLWKVNDPYEVIVVTSDEMRDEIQATCDDVDPTLFTVLSVPKPNKRVQLMAGIHATKTDIVALADDDAIWTENFLEWMLAPFDDDEMGGTGSKQVMIPVGPYATFWEVIADFRLTMRMIETSASTFVDGGMSCISGRTAVYRTKILSDPKFEEAFVNEKWRGKYPLHSGDDKFITRWLVKHSWKMRLQNHKEACLQTTFKNDSKFLKQVLRWTRNTWRSDILSIFVDHKILWRHPYVAFNMFDKFINPLPLIWGMCVIISNIVANGVASVTYVVLPVVAWLIFSRIFRLIPHLIYHPSHTVYIPLMVLFQYYFTFMKIYAAFTLHITDWGSRASADEDDKLEKKEIPRTDTKLTISMDSSRKRTSTSADSSNSSLEEGESQTGSTSKAKAPKQDNEMVWVPWYKRPPVLCSGLVTVVAVLGVVYLGFTAGYHRTIYWDMNVVTNSSSLSGDRATNVALYDSVSNKTFIAFAGPQMDPQVVDYDHNTKTFTDPVTVASANPDYHNYPRMAMANDGHLIVIYTDSPRTLYMSKSPKAHSSDGTWNVKTINEDKPTYPCLTKSSTGDLYVFYRSYEKEIAVDYRPLHYVKSTDDGESWSAPRKAIDTGIKDRSQGWYTVFNMNEVYADCPRVEPAHGNIQERFLMGWTMAGGGQGQNIHNNYHKDAHFAYFYPSTDTFANAEGDDLGDAIIGINKIRSCRVFNSGPLDETNKRIVDYYFAPSYLSDNGYPVMVFNFNKTLISSTWTGSSWEHNEILKDAAYNVFDMEKTGSEDFRLFYPQKDVKIFITSDGGTNWKKEHQVEVEDGVSKVVLVENARSDLYFVAREGDFGRYESTYDERQYEGTYRVYMGKEMEVNPINLPFHEKTLTDR